MTFTVSQSSLIDASAAAVYRVIADYRNGHPRILPKQLTDLEVVEGSGVGAGTVITFRARVLGVVQRFRAVVSEPEPGRVLVETNTEPTPSVTTFIVNPVGDKTNVTITTQFETSRAGLLGILERFATERIIPPMYREELRNLERVARSTS